jgi:hypothetical protein
VKRFFLILIILEFIFVSRAFALTLSNNIFPENLPIGSIVGKFKANELDVGQWEFYEVPVSFLLPTSLDGKFLNLYFSELKKDIYLSFSKDTFEFWDWSTNSIKIEKYSYELVDSSKAKISIGNGGSYVTIYPSGAYPSMEWFDKDESPTTGTGSYEFSNLSLSPDTLNGIKFESLLNNHVVSDSMTDNGLVSFAEFGGNMDNMGRGILELEPFSYRKTGEYTGILESTITGNVAMITFTDDGKLIAVVSDSKRSMSAKLYLYQYFDSPSELSFKEYWYVESDNNTYTSNTYLLSFTDKEAFFKDILTDKIVRQVDYKYSRTNEFGKAVISFNDLYDANITESIKASYFTGIWENADTREEGRFSMEEYVPSPFSITAEGDLKTNRLFDFEQDDQSYNIFVDAYDPEGNKLSGSFVILLQDVEEDFDQDGIDDIDDEDDDGDGFPDIVEEENGYDPLNHYDYPLKPIVETTGSFKTGSGDHILRAKIITDGDEAVTEYGFQFKKLSDSNYKNFASQNISSDGVFEQLLEDLEPSETFLYKAYAKNLAGYNYGSTKKLFSLGAKYWWTTAADLSNGWKSDWMGTFFTTGNEWIYQLQLGWLFTVSDSQNGIWFWMDDKGWLWSSQKTWPFIWKDRASNWLYLMKTDELDYIYDYEISSFELIKK